MELSVSPQYIEAMEQAKKIIIEALRNNITVKRQTQIQLDRM